MLYTIIDSAVTEDSHLYLRVEFNPESAGIYLLPGKHKFIQVQK